VAELGALFPNDSAEGDVGIGTGFQGEKGWKRRGGGMLGDMDATADRMPQVV